MENIICSLQDFVVGLSVLVRGSLEEKLRWTFSLYDQGRTKSESSLMCEPFMLMLITKHLR